MTLAREGSEFDSADDDDRQQRESLSESTAALRCREIAARPVMGQLRSPQIGSGEAEKPSTTTVRASKCRSRTIEIGTSTNIGSAP